MQSSIPMSDKVITVSALTMSYKLQTACLQPNGAKEVNAMLSDLKKTPNVSFLSWDDLVLLPLITSLRVNTHTPFEGVQFQPLLSESTFFHFLLRAPQHAKVQLWNLHFTSLRIHLCPRCTNQPVNIYLSSKFAFEVIQKPCSSWIDCRWKRALMICSGKWQEHQPSYLTPAAERKHQWGRNKISSRPSSPRRESRYRNIWKSEGGRGGWCKDPISNFFSPSKLRNMRTASSSQKYAVVGCCSCNNPHKSLSL